MTETAELHDPTRCPSCDLYDGRHRMDCSRRPNPVPCTSMPASTVTVGMTIIPTGGRPGTVRGIASHSYSVPIYSFRSSEPVRSTPLVVYRFTLDDGRIVEADNVTGDVAVVLDDEFFRREWREPAELHQEPPRSVTDPAVVEPGRGPWRLCVSGHGDAIAVAPSGMTGAVTLAVHLRDPRKAELHLSPADARALALDILTATIEQTGTGS